MLTEEEYYQRFKDYDRNKLFEIISNRDNYQEKALKATLRVIKSKGLEDDLTKLLESIKFKDEQTEEKELDEIIANSEYYSKAVRFKNENNFINIRTSEIIKLESALDKNGIEYFSEDKNIDAFMALYPTHRYYFLTNDLEKVDQIMRELEMTDPQQDFKPFFKFELKTTLIVIIIFLLFVILIALISR